MTFFGDHESFGTAVGEVGSRVLIDVRDDRLRSRLRYRLRYRWRYRSREKRALTRSVRGEAKHVLADAAGECEMCPPHPRAVSRRSGFPGSANPKSASPATMSWAMAV